MQINFFVAIGASIILQLVRDPKQVKPYYSVLAKIHAALEVLRATDPRYASHVEEAQAKL